jgi:hypothetical protein
MHQHPPKIPLLRSTSSANAGHVEASRGRVVYAIGRILSRAMCRVRPGWPPRQGSGQTAHEFEPPDDLDPVAALEDNLGTGWEFPTRVAFDAPPAEVAPWIRPPMGRLHPSGDGCVLTGSTSNPAMYAQEWLASVPFAFRVEAGPELRAATATLAARFAGALAGPAAT